MENRFGYYRQIRAQRTWRPLGKMSWWRIAVGTALLVLVLFMSGVPSQRLAASGHFAAAEKLMLFPGWMEKNKPDSKAFIEAGALYARGETEEAFRLLKNINPSDLSEGEAEAYRLLTEPAAEAEAAKAAENAP